MVLVFCVSIQEHAVLNALPSFDKLDVQDFHLDDVGSLLFWFAAPVTVVVTVVVLTERCQRDLVWREVYVLLLCNRDRICCRVCPVEPDQLYQVI